MYTVVQTGAVIGDLDMTFLESIRRNGHTIIQGSILRNDDGNALPPTQAIYDVTYDTLRQWLYRRVTDPLFFKSQRGEATQAEWQAAIRDIKSTWATPTA